MKRARVSETRQVPGDPSQFVGEVARQNLLSVNEPPSAAILVHFGAGSRTRWHSHPSGQYIYVIEGQGLIQSRGGAIESLRPGDCIFVAPGEVHWHGASESTGLSHIAFSFGITDWRHLDPDDE